MSDPNDPTGPGTPPPPPPPGGFTPPPYGGDFSAPSPPVGAGVLADVGKRGVAALIDYGILFGAYIGVAIVTAMFGAISDALGSLVLILGYLGVGGFSIWNFYIVQGQTGQTIGKKMQGVKLVSQATGQPIGPLMVFVRYLVSGIPCGLGWVLMFFDPMRQQLGDKVSKTIVIDA